MAIELRVNGEPHTLEVDAARPLLRVLREELGLTGAKYGCGEGECGACTVLVDGRPMHACKVPMGDAAGRTITTVEAVARERVGAALAQAFVAEGAMQCAFCTPGMVVAAAGLLAVKPEPTEAEVVAGMDGNICRCGTYRRIVKAVRRAAGMLRGDVVASGAGASGDVVASEPDPEGAGGLEYAAHEIELRGVEGLESQTVWLPAGGLTAVLIDPDEWAPRPAGWERQSGGDQGPPESIGAWIHVAEDGRITGFTGKVEFGQGSRTSLAQMVAEEMRVPAERVHLVMGDTQRTPWDMGTFGSMSTPVAGAVLRKAAAVTRELAAKGETGIHLVRGADVRLTPGTEWRVAGTPVTRTGAGALASGLHRYTSDLRLPDMLYGRVLRAPRAGAELARVDASGARAVVPDAVVVHEGEFVGVAARNVGLAVKAPAQVKAEWSGGSELGHADLFQHLRATAEPRAQPGPLEWGKPMHVVQGDPDGTLAAGPRTLERSYTVEYIAHVPLETRVAVARWSTAAEHAPGIQLTVWTGTQRPFSVRDELAEAFDLPPDQVRVIVPDTGSGYGGKHTPEVALEAARLARAAGRPVRVTWTREEEFRWAYFRPAGIVDVRTAFDAEGRIRAFELENISSGAAGIKPVYAIPNQRLIFRPADSPFRQGSYRALAATANHFARELHVDEIASSLRIDPVELRLRNLKDERAAAVLRAAAERFGWSSAGRGTGTGTRAAGIALGWEKGSYICTAVEIEVPRDWEGGTASPGKPGLRVLRAVSAFDCGAVVNPDNLRNQIEGALVMGLGGALFEAIDFEGGVVSNAHLADYRVPRFSDVPEVEVVVLDRKEARPVGAGETPIIAIAPAIGAALARATGKRPYGMPLARGSA